MNTPYEDFISNFLQRLSSFNSNGTAEKLKNNEKNFIPIVPN